MCVDKCVNSCITWNSGGINSDGNYISNATKNDWHGFSVQDAPRDGLPHYAPMVITDTVNQKNWSTIVNKYPIKDQVPLGYGIAYPDTSVQPTVDDGYGNKIGAADGARGDWDYSNPGEYSWYRNNIRPDDDIDWDLKKKL